MSDCVVFGGRTHPDLVRRICHTLAIEPTKVDTKNFSNGETSVKIHESVRDKDVFVVQTASANVNDALMELLIIVSALKISSAKSVTAVLPLFPYSRQLDAASVQQKAQQYVEKILARERGEPEKVFDSPKLSFPESNPLGEGLLPPESAPLSPTSNRSASPHAHFKLPRKANFGAEPTTRSSKILLGGSVPASTEVSPCLRLVHNPSSSASFAEPNQSPTKRNSFGGFVGEVSSSTSTNAWVSQNGPLVASLLATAGADHVITMDLHDPQYQGFFDIPFDNLLFRPLLLEYIQTVIPNYHSAVIVSPDAGGAQRATAVADHLHTRFALIHQDRRSNATILVGDVNDRVAILVDDIIDSGKTLLRAGRILKDHGALKVYAICTHGLFSDGIVQNFKDSAIDQIVVTNSVPQDCAQSVLGDKLHVVDISLLFAEAIRRVYNGESFSRLYTQPPIAL